MSGEAGQLRLRLLSTEDQEDVFRLTADPRVAQYMRFDAHKKLGQARKLIEEYTRPGNRGFALLDDAGKLFGVLALKRGERPGEYLVTIFLSPDWWGRGVGIWAMGQLVEAARELPAQTLLAYVVEGNAASRRVLEKNGFLAQQKLYFEDLPEGLWVYERKGEDGT